MVVSPQFQDTIDSDMRTLLARWLFGVVSAGPGPGLKGLVQTALGLNRLGDSCGKLFNVVAAPGSSVAKAFSHLSGRYPEGIVFPKTGVPC